MSTKPVVWIAILVVMIGAIAVFSLMVNERDDVPEEVHIHAGFVVYGEEGRRDLSAPVYMSSVPCQAPDDPSPGYIQLHTVHLHDTVGDVVHIHRDGATWSDLFENIGISDEIEDVRAVVYEEPESDTQIELEGEEALTREIGEGESTVFFVNGAEETQDRLDMRPGSERIETIGAQSEASCT